MAALKIRDRIILQINSSVIKFFMDNQIICPSCNDEYREDNLPRILIGCGHTYCQNCLLSFIYEEGKKLWARCPEDNAVTLIQEKNVNKFPKNLALIKVIDSKKQIPPFKESDMNVSKITKNSQPQEEQDSNQLLNIMDSSKQDCSLIKQREKSQNSQKAKSPRQSKETKPTQCPVHKKPMDIVCTVDLTKICASCAIFGDHRGHSFKSLEEVSQIQNSYCDEITAIITEKQKLSKQITCTETKNDLVGLLTSKRNKLRTKIMQEFQKIQTKISNKKKETLKKLDQIVKKQQNNLRNCMKFNDQLVKSYQSWFKKSDSQLKILEENDFEAKLILLFQGKNIDGDLVQEGKNIINEMKVEEENILEEVEKKLQNLSMSVNEDIYNHLDDFIHVTGESYKQISAIIVKTEPQALYIPPISMSYQQGKSSLANSKIKMDIPEKKTEPHPKYDIQKNSYLKMTQTINSSPNLDQSLLENDEEHHEPDVFEFSLRMSEIVPPNNKLRTAPLSQRLSIQPNTDIHSQKPLELKLKNLRNPVPEVQIDNRMEKMSKKKLTKMKLPQRFQKIVEAMLADSLQIFDLTNAEVGDSNMAAICQNITGSKVRNLKLIRNKLTDQGVSKLLPFMGNITTLNLSQNLLTDNVLDILYENKKYLPCLRTVILSQNKIVERKHKLKVDKLKKLDWNVSI